MARRFGVSPSFVVKLVARCRRTGSVAAAKRGRPFGFGKLAEVRDVLIARVEAAPDATLAELTDWLAREHDVRVHLHPVCRPEPDRDGLLQARSPLRRVGARTIKDLWQAIGSICSLYDERECWNCFSALGYAHE